MSSEERALCAQVIERGVENASAALPRYGLALLATLQFAGPNYGLLQKLTDAEWHRLLSLCDTTQLTLLFGRLSGTLIPDWVRERIERNYQHNQCRFERLQSQLAEIAHALRSDSVEFTVLKGFTHSPEFTPDPLLRSQGDIDLWCLPEALARAEHTLVRLGFRPYGTTKGRHLPPMVRENSWAWKGDYYAPDLPIPVDLHYQLWDAAMERMPGPDERGVWTRRRFVEANGVNLHILGEVDIVAFSALHVLMHLLHGDFRIQRAWEVAFFLHHNWDNEPFWRKWQCVYSRRVRHMQVVVFELARQWFGCRLPGLLEREAENLPKGAALWIKRLFLSPYKSLFWPNKHELWLNLALLESYKDRTYVTWRRLLPVQEIAATPEPTGSFEISRKKSVANRAAFVKRRLKHHLRLLPLTCLDGMKWWWRLHDS